MIHNEVSKQSEGNDAMKQVLLSQIIPGPRRDTGWIRGKKNFKNRQQEEPKKPSLKLKKKNLKCEVSVFGEEKLAGTKLRAK